MIQIIVTKNPDPQSEFQPGTYDVTDRSPLTVSLALFHSRCDWQLVVTEEEVGERVKAWLAADLALHVIKAGGEGRKVFLNGERIEHSSDEIVDALAGNVLAFGSVPVIVRNDCDGLYLMSPGVEPR